MTILRDPFATKSIGWWNRLIEPLPLVQNSDTRQKSQLLASVLLMLLLVILVLYLSRLPLHQTLDLEVVSRLVLVVFILISYRFSRRGYYKVICLSAAVVGSLALFGLASVQGAPAGLHILNYLIVVIIFVSLFLSARLTLAIFAAQMIGLVVWAGLIGSASALKVLDEPISFNLALGLIVLLTTHYRGVLEAAHQAQLAASETRFRTLIEQTPVAITVSGDMRFKYVNAAFARLHGFEQAADLIGQPVLDCIAPEYHAQTIAWSAQRQADTAAAGAAHEIVNIRRDGTTFYALETVTPVQLADGPATIAFIQDITERKQIEDALQQSEERYRRLVETSPVGIFIHQEGVIVFANPAALILYGASSAEELVGQPALSVVHPDYHAAVTARIQQMAGAEAQVPLLEQKHVRLDGTVFDVEVAAISFMLHGKLAIQTVVHDITEQHKAVLALKESETKFRTFVEQSADGILLVDERGYIAEWNAANERLTGQRREAVVGQPYWDFHFRMVLPEKRSPELYEYLKTLTLNLVQTGESPLVSQPVEAKHYLPNGTLRVALQTVFPIKTERGYCIGSISRDITERKQAEESLRQSEARQRALLDAVPDLIFRKHRDGTFLDYHAGNPAELAVPPEQFIGRKTEEVLPPEAAARHTNAVARALQTGDMQTYEYTLTVGGQLMDYEARMVVCGSDEVLAIVRNITERKRTQQQAFELALERQRVKVLETFIQDASHDLKTPLSVVQLSTHMLRRITDRAYRQLEMLSLQSSGRRPEQLSSALTEIAETMGGLYQRIDSLDSSAQRLNYLVSSLLEITRLEHQPQGSRSRQDLNALIHDLVDSHQSLAVAREQVMQFEPDQTLPPIMLDSDNFPRVIQNLLRNAVQYTPQWGKIRIRTYQQDRQAVLEVSDTGIGIADADLPHIFERFYRADKARSTDKGGAGLGLAITKHIVETHGGHITVESTPGKGSTFRVFLPLED
ncbi:MAG: PAS domain S-box protein [Anaerolineae bacterium]|nr:PAS domain S-box protein [Anaerolineae bacterium]